MDKDLEWQIDPSVVFQLGESLISDPVMALIELVKNSYDADATYAKVTINTRGKTKEKGLSHDASNGIIIIEDDGFGMSRDDFQNGWLRISNRQKLKIKKEKRTTPKGRSPLGDKGLGRLGTQRLGKTLEIFSTKENSKKELHFGFSWESFSKVKKISDVDISESGKPTKIKKGTKIIISGLREIEVWDDAEDRLQKELSRMISPYKKAQDFFVLVTINGKKLELAEISEKLRIVAQAKYDIKFDRNYLKINGKIKLEYLRSDQNASKYSLYAELDEGREFFKFLLNQKKSKLYGIKKSTTKKWFVEISLQLKLDEIDNLEIASEPELAHKKIYNPGPFNGEVDYFNLGQLVFDNSAHSIYDKISDYRAAIKALQGIGIYRNGFGIRVAQDWLGLGKQQTSGGSFYGLRAENTTGYIAITASENMDLEEMTDREGFKRTPHYINFLKIMEEFVKFAAESQEHIRRSWISFCQDKNEEIAKFSFNKDIHNISNKIRDRIVESNDYIPALKNTQQRMKKGIKKIKSVSKKIDTIEKITPAVKNSLDKILSELEPILEEADQVLSNVEIYLEKVQDIDTMHQIVSDGAENLKAQLNDMLETVALGITAEALSHEIFNTVDTLLERSNSVKIKIRGSSNYSTTVSAFIEYVKSMAISLRKQVSYLSPALKYIRDKKNKIDLNKFLIEFRDHYNSRLNNNGITLDVKRIKRKPFILIINQGKLLQILDNFILNSEYWLSADIKSGRIKKGEAKILFEIDNPFIRISDNGRGIDKRIETAIFEPFITAKRKGKGRGLGLFIVKQLLDSEFCSVGLIPKRNSNRRLYKFQIDFRGVLND